MRVFVFALLALAAAPASADRYAYLVAEWLQNGDQMCRYDNGVVLNRGMKFCPWKIRV